jgi:hypothetical protein
MCPNFVGGWDEVRDKDERESLLIIVAKPMVLVGNKPVMTELFKEDQALNAGRTFVEQLYRLSEAIADQQPDDLPADLSDQPLEPQLQQRLSDSLKLDRATSLKVLIELRKTGAGLRKALEEEAKEVVEQLAYNGFPGDDVQKEPALTFQEDQRVPTLWDMMYEGGQAGLPEWERFWGFRVPITHWVHETRTREIRLQQGFFSAINEDLDFAGREVNLLKQQLRHIPQIKHSNLADALRLHVDHDLQERMQGNADQIEAWWHACHAGPGPGPWLWAFLKELNDDEDLRQILAEEWVKDRLIKILGRTRYDLIHFACHCEASQKTEFLSRLDMRVGGADVSMDVSLMATDMQRERLSADEPGPLVFLNACGTGQMGASYEPPGFPSQWIRGQRALAVVATLCPVPDYFAHAFARKFYEILFGIPSGQGEGAGTPARKRYVAEALLRTRRFFMQEYNNPLGLAYVLYAVRGAYVLDEFGAMSPAAGQ